MCDGREVGLRNAGRIISRPLSTPPDLTGICTTHTAPSHPSVTVLIVGGVRLSRVVN